MKFGIYDKYSTFTTEYRFIQVQSFFKDYQFSQRQDAEAKAAQLGLDIGDILSLNFGGKSSSSSFSQWQQELIKSDYQQAVQAGLKAETVEKISTAMTQLIATCLTKKGLHAYIIPAADNQSFTFTIDFNPPSSTTPTAKGTFAVTPASVAASCTPKGLLDKEAEIGPQGVSVSLRRLPTETVTIVYNTDQGSGTLKYDAYVVPKPVISFRAEPENIQAGQSTKLMWDVKNARSVEIEGKGQVAESGSLEVTPIADTDYRLVVASLSGDSVSSYVKVKVAPPPPVLKSARVFFRTTDNDKDDNTNVTVNIQVGSSTIASVSGDWGHWDNNSDSGWKDLKIIDALKKDTIVSAGRFQLIEAPHGSDEWHFNWTLELGFSDGSTKSYNGSGNVDGDRALVTQAF